MSTSRILRVRRVDATEESPFCLVSVSTESVKKDGPINLKLLATEGSMAFSGSLKHNDITSLKSKSYSGNKAEWDFIIQRTLLHSPILDEHAAALEDLELVASLVDDILNLIWQRKKRTNTQELGSLSLEQTDESIDPFFWTGDAVQAADAAENEIERLREQVSSQETTIIKLREQFQGLADAKLEHEKVLLEKFTSLINSKKLKIRDQQRLLSGVNIDPSTAGHVRDSKGDQSTSGSGRNAEKRKAAAVKEPSESEDDSSDAFEDASMKDADEVQQTPDATDEDTEGDEQKMPTPPPPKQQVRRAIGGKAKAAATVKVPAKAPASSSKSASKNVTKASAQDEDDKSIPPRRDLPFNRKQGASSKKATPPPPEDDSETEDEL